jgi:hypothetical protein
MYKPYVVAPVTVPQFIVGVLLAVVEPVSDAVPGEVIVGPARTVTGVGVWK